MNEPPFFRHIWLMFVAVTVANALVLKFRSGHYIRLNPGLAGGYQRLFRGVLFWGNLPWLVMGTGIELGGVPSVFSFFRPRDGNPFVLAWFGAVVMLWVLGFYWLFARRGAEFLIEHPGLLRGKPKNPALIKACYCIAVVGGIAAVVAIVAIDIPVPR